VEAQAADGRWYPATIASVVAADGSFTVDWADGRLEGRAKRASALRANASAQRAAPAPVSQGSRPAIQPAAAAAAPPARTALAAQRPFAAGDRVEAQAADGRWYPATIAAVVAGDGSFTVDWADGRLEDRAKRASALRVRVTPKPGSGNGGQAAGDA
jgi:ABC-type transport system involved in cytochrome c biogenesis permease component